MHIFAGIPQLLMSVGLPVLWAEKACTAQRDCHASEFGDISAAASMDFDQQMNFIGLSSI